MSLSLPKVLYCITYLSLVLIIIQGHIRFVLNNGTDSKSDQFGPQDKCWSGHVVAV